MRILKVLGLVLSAAVLAAIILLSLRFFLGNEDLWLCQNGEWIKHGNPVAPQPTTTCGNIEQEASTSMANPASVNCLEKGGKVEIKKDESDGEYGMCIFPDGKQCEEWAMFRGECPVGGQENRETTLSKPSAEDSAASPLIIEGSMPGNWYFEASAIAELYDGNGNLLARSPVQAKGEWMTTGSVPFEGKLEFKAPSTPTGTIILRNDNPSGLPENAKFETYPVFFGQQITVFFGNSEKDPEMMDCSHVFSVTRTIAKTTGVGRAALEELLKGPTEKEKDEKYFSSINPGVVINSLTITDGVAKVDFDKQIEYQLGGSCRVTSIRSQIETTLKQFPSVKQVIISVEGRTEDILQP